MLSVTTQPHPAHAAYLEALADSPELCGAASAAVAAGIPWSTLWQVILSVGQKIAPVIIQLLIDALNTPVPTPPTPPASMIALVCMLLLGSFAAANTRDPDLSTPLIAAWTAPAKVQRVTTTSSTVTVTSSADRAKPFHPARNLVARFFHRRAAPGGRCCGSAGQSAAPTSCTSAQAVSYGTAGCPCGPDCPCDCGPDCPCWTTSPFRPAGAGNTRSCPGGNCTVPSGSFAPSFFAVPVQGR